MERYLPRNAGERAPAKQAAGSNTGCCMYEYTVYEQWVYCSRVVREKPPWQQWQVVSLAAFTSGGSGSSRNSCCSCSSCCVNTLHVGNESTAAEWYGRGCRVGRGWWPEQQFV